MTEPDKPPPKRRGSRPGEYRGGRKKGVPNKVTAEVKKAAARYTVEALATLAKIMRHGESEVARIAAAKELLDRGHGKAPQSNTHVIQDERMVVEAPPQSRDAETWVGEHGPH